MVNKLGRIKKSVLFILWCLGLILIALLAHRLLHMNLHIHDFSQGILSMASSRDVDISRVIKWYYAYILLGIPFIAIGIQFFFPKIKCWARILITKIDLLLQGKKEFLIYIACLFIAMLIGRHDKYQIFQVALFALGLIFFIIANKKKHWQDDLESIFTVWLVLIVSCTYLLSMPAVHMTQNAIFVMLAGVSAILAFALYKIYSGPDSLSHLKYAILPILLLQLVLWLLTEFLYTLKAWYYDVSLVPYILFYLIAVGLSYYRWKKWNQILSIKHFYEISVIGFALTGSVRTLWTAGWVDFFEGSNHGVSIYDWISGYGLPVLNNFDAHMLGNTFMGYIYYLINNDFTGALFAPYGYLYGALGTIGLYFIVKSAIGDRNAFLFVLFMPVWNWTWLSVGMIAFAYWCYWYEHICIKNNCILAIIFILLGLYRLDIGVSFGIALVGISVLYLAAHKRYKELIHLIITGALVGSVFLLFVFWCGNRQNIDWYFFINEFIQECNSNQHWAYGILFNNGGSRWIRIQTLLRVTGIYFIIPALLGVILIHENREKDELFFWCIIFLIIAYIMNIPRALVRHSFIEKSFLAYGLPVFILALLLAKQFFHGRRIILACSLIFVTYLLGYTVSWHVPGVQIFRTAQVMRSVESTQHSAVLINKNDQKLIDDLNLFFSQHMKPQDTYIDFTNQSLLYVFTGRDNPSYPNQTPAMINAEKGQLMHLRNIQKVSAPFVLMPKPRPKLRRSWFYSGDGILHTDRYYLLTEYICNNYRPLCSVDEMAIWCRNQDYDKLHKKILIGKREPINTYDYNFADYYRHNLGYIPFLWGQFYSNQNDLDVVGNLQSKGNNIYEIPKNSFAKPCYIILEINSPTTQSVSLQFKGNGLKQSAIYNFNVRSGTHSYRLRISSDILWYSRKLNTMIVQNGKMRIEKAFCAKPEQRDVNL